MSQHDYVIADQAGLAVLADINDALAAIASNNSGLAAPTTTFAHMWWADTTAGLLKRRNAANTAWISVMSLTLAISAFIETLLTAANAAAARTAIGAAEAGVNASITEIAGLTTPLSVGQGGTGGITPSLALTSLGFSAFIKTLIDDADAATARATLGIGGRSIGQIVTSATSAVATGITTIPWDDTIPQSTEGDQYMSLAITPQNASSTLVIDVVMAAISSSVATDMIAALFQDSTANALTAADAAIYAGSAVVNIKFTHIMAAGTTSATTFKVRAGGNAAGTTTFNGAVGARRLGGVLASRMTITEILP